MGQRGRQSRNDIAIAAATDSIERPGPNPGLTDEQKFEWVRIVNDFPADYFTAAQIPLLEQYVKHRVEAGYISKMLAKMREDFGDEEDVTALIKVYDKFLNMQQRESRTMASLGVRLGFAKTAHREQGGKKSIRNPWE